MRTSRTTENAGGIKWSPMVILSVCFHLALFSALFLVPEPLSRGMSLGGVVYEVDLVEMPGSGPGQTRARAIPKGETKATIPKETKAKRIEQEMRREEKPLIIAKKTAEKEAPSTKGPEVSPSELIDKAISKIEKKVKSDEYLDQAISKIEQKVSEEQPSRGAGPGNPDEATGGITGTAMQIYLMEVENLIKSNWAYPATMERRKDLEAIVVLTVKSDGSVTQTRFQKRSPSPLFDDTVIKAIERSNPLPPFPEGYKRSHEEFEINFNLKDLKGD
jgi:colicin import membrane protein